MRVIISPEFPSRQCRTCLHACWSSKTTIATGAFASRSSRACRFTIVRHGGGQSVDGHFAARIDVNERAAERGKAISNENNKDALRSLNASPQSTLAGKLAPLGNWSANV